MVDFLTNSKTHVITLPNESIIFLLGQIGSCSLIENHTYLYRVTQSTLQIILRKYKQPKNLILVGLVNMSK